MKKLSETGYKKNSPDKNNPYNVIPSGNITMQDVLFPVTGISMETGQIQHMKPGADYTFPDTNHVLEYPMFMQTGGQPKYTPEQWNKINMKKGLVASPGSSVNISGKQNSKYMEFYDPSVYKPSVSDSGSSSEINWSKINDPNWKYTNQNDSPFINYTAPLSLPTNQKMFIQPTNERTAIGFQPNYTTYKYNDGTTKYQDMKGNIYNNTDELQQYLEGLVKMKNGGPLNKFVGNYAKQQINLSQAPQGQSMDDFLTKKNMDFIEFISDNTNKVLNREAKNDFKKFQMGGPKVNLDNPNDPLQSSQSNNFYTSGPFGPYGQQNPPDYVNQYTQQYNFPLVNSNVGTQSGLNLTPDTRSKFSINSFTGEDYADIAMLGTQATNGIFNRAQSAKQAKINSEKTAIYNTTIPQYGNKGDYDINSGTFRPNQYTPTQFKKGGQKKYKAGGEYKISSDDLGSLLSEGFEFEIID